MVKKGTTTVESLNTQKKKNVTKTKLVEKETKEVTLTNNKVALDELIPVMSLINYRLNLSTEKNGQGKDIYFTHFGQIDNILYQDLLDVMRAYRSFMEHGYFVILDERVIARHGLQDVYKKILTKEKIEEILDGSEGTVELYKSSNPDQQSVIVRMVIEKLREDPDSIDLNIVDQLSRISGTKIKDFADEAREQFLYRKQQVEALQ